MGLQSTHGMKVLGAVFRARLRERNLLFFHFQEQILRRFAPQNDKGGVDFRRAK